MPEEVHLTTAQSRMVDEIAINDYGLLGLVLMENAGRGVVDVLRSIDPHGPIAVCCGRGNNAGDGFVIARHLAIHEIAAEVHVFDEPDLLSGDAAVNFRALEAMGATIRRWPSDFKTDDLRDALSPCAWVLDALLGTGARGEPRPPYDRVIDAINDSGSRVLAIDAPSGLDCDTGSPSSHCVRASHTCTFVARKTGFPSREAAEHLGEVHVVSIGAPPEISRRIAEDDGNNNA